MSQFNSFSYRRSAPGRHSFDLSGQVIGTHDFGVPYRPVFCREVVPGDKWHIKLSSFVRASAMVLPTFGSVRLVNRFFYVPMRMIHSAWNEFQDGQLYSTASGEAITPGTITLTNLTLCSAFRYADTVEDQEFYRPAPGTFGDFNWYYQDGESKVACNYTRKGMIALSVLKGLGYTINWDSNDSVPMSAMPLLAYAKICYDWLVDSNFVNSVDFQVKSLFNLTNGNLTVEQVVRVLKVFATCYDKDYFTSAWQAPNQVDVSTNGNPSQNIQMPGWLGSGTPGVIQHQNQTELFLLNSSRAVSAYGLDALRALKSFVDKRLFTGFRIDKQVEADFGLKMSYLASNRSLYLGSVETPIQISDVMSQGSFINVDDPDYSVRLGEYAGKAIGYEDGVITFEPDQPEFGFIICMSAIVPDTAYYEGRHRELFHIKRDDYFTAAFEILGVQAIRNDELFALRDGFDSSGYAPNGVFGYAPRYSEYKCGVQTSNVLGDFLIKSRNNGMNAFHLFREFKGVPTNNYSFKTTADATQFNRIFDNISNSFEHFNVSWRFDIMCERMMSQINDITDDVAFGPGDQMKHMDDLLHG